MSRWESSFARAVVRYRMVLLFACLAGTLVAWSFSRDLQPDRSLLSLFAPDDPRLLKYREVERDFGSEATCIVAYTDPELFTATGMRRLADLRGRLAAVGGVKSTVALCDLPRPSRVYRSKTLLEWFEDSTDAEAIRAEVLACDLYIDQFVGRDGETTAVLLTLDRATMASDHAKTMLNELRALAASHKPEARVVGTPIMISDTYKYLEEDSRVLRTVSLAVMTTVILLLFRSVRWMVLPLIVVQVSIIWTDALMAATSIQLSIIGSMTTSLVTVIGIATVIHIAVRFKEEFEQSGNGPTSLAKTIEMVGAAIFWTCLTTAAGFGSLATSRVQPVRNFALVMGSASLFVGAVCLLVLPGGILLGRFRSAPRTALGEQSLGRGLGRVVPFLQRRRAWSIAGTLAVLLFAAAGLARVEVETDFTRNFKSSSSIISAYRFVEERLGGVGFIELAFDAPASLDASFLASLRACLNDLRAIPGVTKATGLTDVLDFAESAVPAPATTFASFLPEDGVAAFKLRVLKLVRPEVYRGLYNAETNRMRVILRVREQQAVQGKRGLIEEVEKTAKSHVGESAVATGLYVLLVFLIDNILGDQWMSFAISAAAILVMVSFAFRSVKLGLIALVPNVVPFLIVLGGMGWLGLRINVATAMIGSISMGLVVDFSLHYLNRLRQEQREGSDFITAMIRTHSSTGKAMVFANLALMLGFSVLTVSNFVPTIHFGILVSVAICGGLIGNLVVLPLLLQIFMAPKVDRPSAG